MGARYYDAQVGRFITRDTDLDEHPYLYCEHDPVNSVDPSGHWTASIGLGAMGQVIFPGLQASASIVFGQDKRGKWHMGHNLNWGGGWLGVGFGYSAGVQGGWSSHDPAAGWGEPMYSSGFAGVLGGVSGSVSWHPWDKVGADHVGGYSGSVRMGPTYGIGIMLLGVQGDRTWLWF